MSYAHVWSRNIWLLLCPAVLSYDWQMGSIPLVTRFSDPRNIVSAGLLTTVGALLCYVVITITSPVCNAHLPPPPLLLLVATRNAERNVMQLVD